MPGNALLRDVEIRKLRAQRMIDRRITGHSNVQIGAEFGIAPSRAADEIRWFIRNGFLADIESRIVTNLAEKAVEVYEKRLKGGDPDVAKHVLDLTVKLGDRIQKQGHQEAELGLRAYMAQKKADKDEQTAETGKPTSRVVSVDKSEQSGIAAPAAEGIVLDLVEIARTADGEATFERTPLAQVRSAEADSDGSDVEDFAIRDLEEDDEDA